MHPITEEILEKWQVRKTAAQKAAFRAFLSEKLAAEGIALFEERKGTSDATVNLVVGDPERAPIFFTAHYDTCARLPIPNFMAPMNFLLTFLYQMLLIIVPMAASIGLTVLIGVPMAMSGVPSTVVGGLAGLLCWGMFSLIIYGPANPRNANDNTSGVAVLLETLLSMPEADRARCCFVFFDNEEKGLVGARLFLKQHPRVSTQKTLINFDCVSDGDHLLLVLSKKLQKDTALVNHLEPALPLPDGKTLHIAPTSRAFYPSDQFLYKKSVGVAALHHKKGLGLYMSRIHTPRDTRFDRANIEALRQFAVNLV